MKLNCHCGNVNIDVSGQPQTLTSCNCSICRRYGALWGYYPPEEVSITTKSAATRPYIWGDRCIDFHHCPLCGCVTHSRTTEKVAKPLVAVNFRMTEASQIETVRIRRFDGADTWKYLD